MCFFFTSKQNHKDIAQRRNTPSVFTNHVSKNSSLDKISCYCMSIHAFFPTQANALSVLLKKIDQPIHINNFSFTCIHFTYT